MNVCSERASTGDQHTWRLDPCGWMPFFKVRKKNYEPTRNLRSSLVLDVIKMESVPIAWQTDFSGKAAATRRRWTEWWVSLSRISNFPYARTIADVVAEIEGVLERCDEWSGGKSAGAMRHPATSIVPRYCRAAAPRRAAPGVSRIRSGTGRPALQANGIGFLAAEIPLRTFTPRRHRLK